MSEHVFLFRIVLKQNWSDHADGENEQHCLKNIRMENIINAVFIN